MTPRKRSAIRAEQIKARKAQRRIPAPPMPLPEKRSPNRWPVVTVLLIIAVIAAGLFWSKKKSRPAKEASQIATSPLALNELVNLRPDQLDQMDIAEMNLLCAGGLRGSEGLDITKALSRLDQIAAQVKQETDRHIYQFRTNPADYGNSEAYFRMLMLATVLQQDFGVRYNPMRVTLPGTLEPNEKFYADAKDSFINGLTDLPTMGTCASMPVFYIAIGRRLKYPLSLVAAKSHLFVRWQDAKERINIEATSKGLVTDTDEWYRKFPYPIKDEEIEPNGYLRSMTASEELACFLSIRAMCLMTWNRSREAVDCARAASRLAPQIAGYRDMIQMLEREARAREMFDRQLQVDQVNWLLDREGDRGIPYPTRASRNKLLQNAGSKIASPPTNAPPQQ